MGNYRVLTSEMENIKDGQFSVEMDLPYHHRKAISKVRKEKANMAKKQFRGNLPHQTHKKRVFRRETLPFLQKWATQTCP